MGAIKSGLWRCTSKAPSEYHPMRSQCTVERGGIPMTNKSCWCETARTWEKQRLVAFVSYSSRMIKDESAEAQGRYAYLDSLHALEKSARLLATNFGSRLWDQIASQRCSSTALIWFLTLVTALGTTTNELDSSDQHSHLQNQSQSSSNIQEISTFAVQAFMLDTKLSRPLQYLPISYSLERKRLGEYKVLCFYSTLPIFLQFLTVLKCSPANQTAYLLQQATAQ